MPITYPFAKHLPAIAHLLGVGQFAQGLNFADDPYFPVLISFSSLLFWLLL
jgi:hypothetical protein